VGATSPATLAPLSLGVVAGEASEPDNARLCVVVDGPQTSASAGARAYWLGLSDTDWLQTIRKNLQQRMPMRLRRSCCSARPPACLVYDDDVY